MTILVTGGSTGIGRGIAELWVQGDAVTPGYWHLDAPENFVACVNRGGSRSSTPCRAPGSGKLNRAELRKRFP